MGRIGVVHYFSDSIVKWTIKLSELRESRATFHSDSWWKILLMLYLLNESSIQFRFYGFVGRMRLFCVIRPQPCDILLDAWLEAEWVVIYSQFYFQMPLTSYSSRRINFHFLRKAASVMANFRMLGWRFVLVNNGCVLVRCSECRAWIERTFWSF